MSTSDLLLWKLTKPQRNYFKELVSDYRPGIFLIADSILSERSVYVSAISVFQKRSFKEASLSS